MNRFNKGKLVGIVAASLAGISLIGVGFATWVIGIKNTTAKNDVDIVADDVKYQSLKVSVKFTGGITLAETGTASKDSVFNYENGKTGNLKVSTTFTFTLGKDFDLNEFKTNYNVINFSFVKPLEEGFVDNTVASGEAFTRTETTDSFTYFELPDSVTGLDSLEFTDEATKDVKTATKTVDLQFKWGSLFGNDKATTEGEGISPMNYYNKTLEKAPDKETYMQNAYKELKAMESKYSTGKQLKLQIDLGKNA